MMNSFELTDVLMPHGHCILWSHPLLEIFVITNLVIGFSYFLIPYFLYRIWQKSKSQLKFSANDLSVILWSIGFVMLCGMTHFSNAFTMWVPAWWTQALIDTMTAVVSVRAIFSIRALAKRISLFPSIEEFNKVKKERDMLLQAVEDKKQLAVS